MIKKLYQDFINNYSIDERLLYIMVISLMLPFYISLIVIIGIALLVIIKKDLIKLTKKMKSSYFLFAFGIYLIIISLLNQNWIGLSTSIIMLLIFINVIYYRNYINKNLFENIVDSIIIISVIAIIFSFVEQIFYVKSFNNLLNFFDIYNSPNFRVHAFYFNANYYAMIILFVEAFCVYKLLTNPHYHKWYFFVIIINIFPLYLTGSRMAWLCIIFTLSVMFLGARKYFALLITIICTLLICICLYFNIPIIPRLIRFDLIEDRRFQIYENAFLMIKDDWLFGKGPYTYLKYYQEYTSEFIATFGKDALPSIGLGTWHAHSALLDPIISYGLIGCLLLWSYSYANFRRIFYVLSNKLDRSLATLLIGSLVAVISANILDYSIFWLQTGTMFLIILGSFDIYRQQILAITKDYDK